MNDERTVRVQLIERDGKFYRHKLTGVSSGDDNGYGVHELILNFPLSFGKTYLITIGEIREPVAPSPT